MAKGQKTGGRSAGTPNEVTKTVKDTYENAFIMLQTLKGHDLISWAKENKTDFYKLAIRLIPQEVEAKVTQRIERVDIVINDREAGQHFTDNVASETGEGINIIRH